ncbi:hypothetical protein Poli38472_006730 [Pythium oligandrum]|uniref:HTH CENPB-type domain-containing protein n=1 Tax=Pythium oligandrum TaxID=41045 RepID=A0A8K1C5H6_PYTOL|nr:hypothetical protein Poli38472_006730 [Pythium oligandrum]|eukprot:TMW56720.1 hypothetical protein Poli38472_006730 [Pythium oligandrum]
MPPRVAPRVEDEDPKAVAVAAARKKKRSNALKGRSFLNHQQRLEIIKKKDEEPKWTQVQLARWAAAHFRLPKEPSQATIAVLLKKRDKIKSATVRPQTRTIRSPRHPELESALLLWVRYLQSKRIPFTGENIRLKASFLAGQLGLETSLNFSTGWMSGFVRRHNLVLARAHKKRYSESEEEPVRSILQNYHPRDIFAMDEAALIYNDLPFSREEQASLSDAERPESDRICVGLAVNMDCSEKCDPIIVSTTKRSFRLFPESYYNVDGTMTARIFEQWLYKLNQRMAAIERRIVLLVDGEPSHFPMELSHVRLVLLTYKIAQRSHPFEAGIVKSFKALYRKAHLSFAVDQAEEGRPHVFDVSLPRALQWLKQAWHEVSPELIRNCWARSGLLIAHDQLPATDVADIHPEVVQSLVVSLSQLQLLESVPIETLFGPRAEEEAHYVYDDATIVRIVAGETYSEDTDVLHDSAHEEEEEDELMQEPDDTPHYPRSSQQPALRPAPVAAVIPRRYSEDNTSHVYDVPPSAQDLLACYRGVIWSLDAESDTSEEHVAVMRFLRRKQAALRLHQQQQNGDTQQTQPSTTSATPAAPSSRHTQLI